MMEKENPLEFLKRKAGELGINERELCNGVIVDGEKVFKLPEWYIPQSQRIEEKVQQFSVPCIIKRAVRNPKSNLEFIYGIRYLLDREKNDSGILVGIEEISKREYFFTLSEKGFVRIIVNDENIIRAEPYMENYPQEYFVEGNYYQPALLWMLEKYAGKHGASSKILIKQSIDPDKN